MFSEFFCNPHWKTTAAAWAGLCAVVGYSVFLAYVKAQINDFYTHFYDLMQQAGTVAVVDVDSGSGGAAADSALLADYRAQVWAQLWSFAKIVAPLVSASPAAKWARSAWAFAWRLSLMKAYLNGWDTTKEPIEGASQRLHEDTQRFCSALQGCLATILDAVFTLVVFTPILLRLSHKVAPPVSCGLLDGGWLWLTALAAACVGLGGAALFGQKLVALEINNQRVEASLRKDLVLLETTPAVIVGVPSGPCIGDIPSQATRVGVETHHYAPSLYFGLTLHRLYKNYHALFRHFSLLNFWLSLYDQVMIIFPYLVAAPLLFADDPAERITLGTLVQVSNSFDKARARARNRALPQALARSRKRSLPQAPAQVFSSLSVIAENWGAVNEFRSVFRRLREFEGKLYLHRPPRASGNCLLPPPTTARKRGARAQRSESLTHTISSDDDAASYGAAPRNGTRHTELVVVQGGPVPVHCTYGADAHPPNQNPVFDMRV